MPRVAERFGVTRRGPARRPPLEDQASYDCAMTEKRTGVSPGGSEIFRYDEPPKSESTVPAPSPHVAEIEKHFDHFFGTAESVFHEIVSDPVHIDVHIIAPQPTRNWWTLYTTGMSDRPMTVPQGKEKYRFAELVLALPPEWQIGALKITPRPDDLEQWYWPIRWLKQLARFPHEYGTWLAMGHSMPNGDPPQPLAPKTQLSGWILLPPISVPEEGRTASTADGRTVHLYSLHALHTAEMSLKLNQGTEALVDAFDRADVSEVLRPDRPPAVRRKLFGLF